MVLRIPEGIDLCDHKAKHTGPHTERTEVQRDERWKWRQHRPTESTTSSVLTGSLHGFGQIE